MKINAYKKCDICGKIVAKKRSILFHTEEAYLTIRRDDYAPSYYKTNTIKDKTHVCYSCWLEMQTILRQQTKARKAKER